MKIKIPIWHGGMVTYGDNRDLDESTSPYSINTNTQRPGTLRSRRTDRRLTTLAERSIDAGINVRHPDIITNPTRSSDIHGTQIWINDPNYQFDPDEPFNLNPTTEEDDSSTSGSGSGASVGSIGDIIQPFDIIGDINNYIWIVWDTKNESFTLLNQNFNDVGISTTGGQWVYHLKKMSGLLGKPRFYSIGNAVYVSFGAEAIPQKINFFNRETFYFGTIFQPFYDKILGTAQSNALQSSRESDKLSNVVMDIQSPSIRNGYLKFHSLTQSQATLKDSGFKDDNMVRYLMAPIIDGVTEMPMFQTSDSTMTGGKADDGHTIQTAYDFENNLPNNWDPDYGFKNDITIVADLKKFDPRVTGISLYRAENLNGASDTQPFSAKASDWRKIRQINFVVPSRDGGRDLNNENMLPLSDSIYIPPIENLPQFRWSDSSFWRYGDGITGGVPCHNRPNNYGSDYRWGMAIMAVFTNEDGHQKKIPLATLDNHRWFQRGVWGQDPPHNGGWSSIWMHNYITMDSHNYTNEAFHNGQLFHLGVGDHNGHDEVKWGGFALPSHLHLTNQDAWVGDQWMGDGTDPLPSTMTPFGDPNNPDEDDLRVNHHHIWTKNFCMLNGDLYYLDNTDKDSNMDLYDESGLVQMTAQGTRLLYRKIPNVELEVLNIPVLNFHVNWNTGLPIPTASDPANLVNGSVDTDNGYRCVYPWKHSSYYDNYVLTHEDGSPIRLKNCSFGQNVYMKRTGDSIVTDELRGRGFANAFNPHQPNNAQSGYFGFQDNNGSVLGNDSRCIMAHVDGNYFGDTMENQFFSSQEHQENIGELYFNPMFQGVSDTYPVLGKAVSDGYNPAPWTPELLYSNVGMMVTTSKEAEIIDTTMTLNGTTDVHITFTDENIPPGDIPTTLEQKHLQTKYNCSTFHMGRLFVGNVIINASSDPEEFQDMIIYSDVGSIDKLSPVNYIQIKDSNSGTIQGMASLGSSIAVFMENSIYNLHTPSIDPSQFRIMEAVDYLGLSSVDICSTLSNVYFASHDGIYELSKMNFALTNISLPIKDEYMIVGEKEKTQISYHADNNSVMCIFGNNKNVVFEYNIGSKTWSMNSWRTANLTPIDTSVPIPEDNHLGQGDPILLNSVLGDVVAIDNLGAERNTWYEIEVEQEQATPMIVEPTYPEAPDQTIEQAQEEQASTN